MCVQSSSAESTIRFPKITVRKSKIVNAFQVFNIIATYYCGITRSYPEFLFFMGLFLLVFLWRELKPRHAGVLVLAALSCFAFAVGLDFIEGLDRDHPLNVYARIDARYDFT